MLREITREEYLGMRYKRSKYLVLLDEFLASGYVAAEVTDCGDCTNLSRAVKHFGKAGIVKVVQRGDKTYLVNKLREAEYTGKE